MNKGFWQNLGIDEYGNKKPIMALAPMYHVTDAAFRGIIAKYGKPDVFFTEFVSVDGLMSEGGGRLKHLLKYNNAERPVVAQIWGTIPDNFRKVARILADMGFDGIDINFGCPEKNVVKKYGGCGVMKNLELARDIINSTIAGSGDLPVSVKTRIGYNHNIVEEWAQFLLQFDLAAVTIHARTKKEMSKVPAHWESIKKAVLVRDKIKSDTLIIGNGDVRSLIEANDKVSKYNCDGVMIGRAIFGNPWLFNKEVNKEDLKLDTVLSVLLEHTILFDKYFHGIRNLDIMKKHFASYIHGFPNTKSLKLKLMDCKTVDGVKEVIDNYLKKV